VCVASRTQVMEGVESGTEESNKGKGEISSDM
jgi:hypothetical protein